MQTLLGDRVYKTNDLLYPGGMIACVHCGGQVTGRKVVKKSIGKEHVYYRCTMYNRGNHPRVRQTAQKIDEQVLALFASMRQSGTVRDWFTGQIRKWATEQQHTSRENISRIQRDLSLLRDQQDKLLNLCLLDQIDAHTFARRMPTFATASRT